MKPRILFVDGETADLEIYRQVLRDYSDSWDMRFVACPLAAWEMLLAEPFSVVVANVRMPGMTGIELLDRIQQHDTIHVPLIVAAATHDRSMLRRALSMGAADILSKPTDADELTARLQSVLRLHSYQEQIRSQETQIEKRVQSETLDMAASRADIVLRLAKMVELRDDPTGLHVLRVGCISRIIGEELSLPKSFLDDLFLAAPLHDIGKIGIPDAILKKPGSLSPEEWRVMRTHCPLGSAILRDDARATQACQRWGGFPASSYREAMGPSLLKMACDIAMSHHEKWDGTGYPRGLAGECIPLAARIVAIADVYDTLRSLRAYRAAYTLDKTLGILQAGSGSQFDPAVLGAFFSAHGRILQVEAEFMVAKDVEPLIATRPRLAAG